MQLFHSPKAKLPKSRSEDRIKPTVDYYSSAGASYMFPSGTTQKTIAEMEEVTGSV